MTTTNLTATEIFADARADALCGLGAIRGWRYPRCAEKAWCAVRRATDALILSRTGDIPSSAYMARRTLDELVDQNPAVKVLVGRYLSRLTDLHMECFYHGMPPTTNSLRRIRETDQYIADAERLANT